MKHLIRTGATSLGFLLLVSPAFALAQTTSVQSEIAALLAELQQLQAQIAQLQGQSDSTASSCINLSDNLYAGETDAQTGGKVSQLQQFLGVSPTTGYFGPLTLQAVQNWQSSHGIVSSGTPDTTGYGFVGPRTIAAMSCGTGQTTVGPNTLVPSTAVGPNTLIPSTTSMNIPLTQGSTNSFTRAIVLTNSAASTITYTLSVPNQPSWLNVSYSTAPLTLQSGGTASVAVSATASGLAAGTYSTTLIVQGNFSTSPIKLPITLTVSASVSTVSVSASCHGTPYDSGTPGISWASTPSGGNGSYTYQWTLANDSIGTGISGTSADLQGQNLLAIYGSTGTKSATVVVSSGGQSATASCSATIDAS